MLMFRISSFSSIFLFQYFDKDFDKDFDRQVYRNISYLSREIFRLFHLLPSLIYAHLRGLRLSASVFVFTDVVLEQEGNITVSAWLILNFCSTRCNCSNCLTVIINAC